MLILACGCSTNGGEGAQRRAENLFRYYSAVSQKSLDKQHRHSYDENASQKKMAAENSGREGLLSSSLGSFVTETTQGLLQAYVSLFGCKEGAFLVVQRYY